MVFIGERCLKSWGYLICENVPWLQGDMTARSIWEAQREALIFKSFTVMLPPTPLDL